VALTGLAIVLVAGAIHARRVTAVDADGIELDVPKQSGNSAWRFCQP